MNGFFLKNRLLVILIGIVILIGLIGFSLTDRADTTRAEEFASDTAATSQSIIGAPFRFLNNVFSNVTQSFNAVNENQQLKAQLEMLPQMEADIERLREENERLTRALDVSSKMKYDSIHARVISRSPDQWLENFTVDKGELDGVNEGMAVMTPEGFIGIVSRANGSSSYIDVLSNTLSQNNISVEIDGGDERIYGNISHYDVDTKELIIENIKNRSDFEVDDAVYTSGLVGNIPEGLLIGEVTEIMSDEYGLSESAKVKLATNMDDVDVVYILHRDPESTVDE